MPWQRVIGVRGHITHSSESGGAELQRRLLEAEGIEFGPRDDVDMDRFRWEGPDWSELDQLLRSET